ncbi:MAG: signal peptidase I [Clostridia bacterium]|nr:signal peptidase I [Clostridia bacterium]
MDKTAKKNSAAAELFEWLEMAILSACAVLLLFTFILRPARVDGHSMDYTLADGQMLLLSDICYQPKYGDILVFQKINAERNEPIVKRVIATAGQTVDIDFDTWQVSVTDTDGKVTVYDESSYVNHPTGEKMRPGDQTYPLTVGEDQLFVMGDNRNNSLDSRYSMIGLIDRNEVIGKVFLRFFPLNKFSLIW